MPINEMISVTPTPQELFTWAGQLATVGWVILVFFPRQVFFLFIIPQCLIPFVLGLLYSGLVLAHFFSTDGGYNSIEQVRSLFANDQMLLAGWVHYLAFDLFVGSRIAQSADKLGMSRLLQGPILIATFMFGPIGLVLFLGMRIGLLNNSEVSEKEAQNV